MKKPKTSSGRPALIAGIALLAATVALLSWYLPRLAAVEPPLSSVVSAASDPLPESEVELADNPINFAAMQAKYPDAIGWIRVPGTVIDYPIMQSSAEGKEDFYLDHDPAGEQKREGSIYIQKVNKADFTDPNTVIYGHNMATGRMFAALHKYKNGDFFDNNQLIYVYLPGHILTYRIYSTFIHEPTHLLYAYDYSTAEGYEQFLQTTLHPTSAKRQVREGITPTATDRVITLSTCTNRSEGDNRLLVVAVLEEDVLTK